VGCHFFSFFAKSRLISRKMKTEAYIFSDNLFINQQEHSFLVRTTLSFVSITITLKKDKYLRLEFKVSSDN